MSSIIRMNNAHDENISFCPASGSVEWRYQLFSRGVNAQATHPHLPDPPHHRSAALYD